MPHPSMIMRYVDDATASAAFYTELLGRAPVEASPTFALFVLESGMALGLWARAGVAPAPEAAGGGGELCFKQDSDAAVDALHADWRERGWPILQAPCRLDFGHTFVAADPDGHRLRVYCLHD